MSLKNEAEIEFKQTETAPGLLCPITDVNVQRSAQNQESNDNLFHLQFDPFLAQLHCST